MFHIVKEEKSNKAQKDIVYFIDENYCHICTSHSKTSAGYYQLKRFGISLLIHRYIYELHNEEIPDGFVIRHKCDNKSCINPDHLELGKPIDNSQDMIERGRSLKGERNASSKLSESDVLFIKTHKDISKYELSLRYGVSERTIRDIWNNRSWSHIKV